MHIQFTDIMNMGIVLQIVLRIITQYKSLQKGVLNSVQIVY
jgi:hypothetical protein